MSILRTLNIGAAGMRSNTDAVSVTGDNIANVNTVGFKSQRAVFQDVLGRSVATFEAVKGAGSGSRLAHVEQMWAEGAIVTTDSPTDLAIEGTGFFVVEGNLAGTQARYYTRAGQFHVDNTGKIVNIEDMALQGYTVDSQGVMGALVGDLVITQGTVPAAATTAVQMSVNLDASEAPPVGGFVQANPGATSNFSSEVTVYDSLGGPHEITVYFVKTAANAWDWHALVDSADVGGLAGTTTEGASGSLTFTTNGELDTETPGVSSWDFLNATPAQAIAFDFGTSITTDGGTGLDGTTQFDSAEATIGLKQNGFSAGSIAGISISQDGTVLGLFSNGQERALGQVVTADFANVNGLARAGNGMWIQTLDSGEALIGPAGSGGRGSIVSGALEQSNVDLGIEFVNLIAYQRGFQASSRVITTADEIYGELVNIKR